MPRPSILACLACLAVALGTACGAKPPGRVGGTAPVASASAPASAPSGSAPPTEPTAERLVLGSPWAPSPRVPPKALDVTRVRSTAVEAWSEDALRAELGIATSASGSPTAPDLPGVLRGALLADAGAGAGAETPYRFSSTGKTTATALFVSDGRGIGFAKGARRQTLDGRVLSIDVAAFARGTSNPWGLSNRAHLVEVEVDGGHGDASHDGLFVVTNVRVLDGTAAFPLDLEAALSKLEARAAARVKVDEPRFGAAMGAAEKTLPGGSAHVEPRLWIERVERTLSWNDARSELWFTYVRRASAPYAGPTERRTTDCGDGRPCQQQVTTPRYELRGAMLVRQKVEASGVLLEETTYAPHAAMTPVAG